MVDCGRDVWGFGGGYVSVDEEVCQVAGESPKRVMRDSAQDNHPREDVVSAQCPVPAMLGGDMQAVGYGLGVWVP